MINPDQTKPNLKLKSKKTTVLSDKKWQKTFFAMFGGFYTPTQYQCGHWVNIQLTFGIFQILILAQDRFVES